MTASGSYDEYARRMHRVQAYIDDHLERSLELAEVANVAHFSPFHFHRLFAAWMGETLGDYLRRRRLEVAVMRLVAQPRVPVLNIALSVGFSSAEAFARAFKQRFGCTATEWRTNTARQREQERRARTGRSNPGQMLGRPRYGISHDDPDITAEKKCRYDAAVEVPSGFVPTGGALTTTIPGGRYAAMHFRGTSAEIVDAWRALLRDWLPRSNMQLDARPCFEYYPLDASYDPATGIFDCELVIPIAPL